MKISRIIAIIAVVVIVLVVLAAVASLLTPAGSSVWSEAATYPVSSGGVTAVAAQPCLNATSAVYCIGGEDYSGGPRNSVFTSSLVSASSANVTSWVMSPSYNITAYADSCVQSSGYVYCVGGTYDDTGDDTAHSYYATVGSDGVTGQWSQTTSYPYPVDSQYCTTSSAYIYCVGGFEESDGMNASSTSTEQAWFAPLSASGIGTWTNTTAYPSGIAAPSCYSGAGTIYCIGGVDSSGDGVSTVYYASLSSTGIGNWTETSAYPYAGIGQACVITGGYIYCVGGETSSGFVNSVYYATASSTGVGTWTKGPNYPDSAWTSCATVAGYMYCVGGVDNSSNQISGSTYFAALTALRGQSTTTS